jgi:hypothetical protein
MGLASVIWDLGAEVRRARRKRRRSHQRSNAHETRKNDMKLRTGRHLDRTIYIQNGDEPSDNDELLGLIIDPARAKLLIDIANGDVPPFSPAPPQWIAVEDQHGPSDSAFCWVYGPSSGIALGRYDGTWHAWSQPLSPSPRSWPTNVQVSHWATLHCPAAPQPGA